MDAAIWREEAALAARDLAKLGDRLPHAIRDQQAMLELRLEQPIAA